MKKQIAFSLALSVLFCFFACGQEDDTFDYGIISFEGLENTVRDEDDIFALARQLIAENQSPGYTTYIAISLYSAQPYDKQSWGKTGMGGYRNSEHVENGYLHHLNSYEQEIEQWGVASFKEYCVKHEVERVVFTVGFMGTIPVDE